MNVRVRGVGEMVRVAWPELEARPPGEPHATHDVWFRVDGKPTALPCPFYQRDDLAPGQRVTGPAVIQQFESTAVIPPDRSMVVDSHGVLIVDLTETSGEGRTS